MKRVWLIVASMMAALGLVGIAWAEGVTLTADNGITWSSGNLYNTDPKSLWRGNPVVFEGFNVSNGQQADPTKPAIWRDREYNWSGLYEDNIDAVGADGKGHRVFVQSCSVRTFDDCNWTFNGNGFAINSQAQYDQGQGAHMLQVNGGGVSLGSGRLAVNAMMPAEAGISLPTGACIYWQRPDQGNPLECVLYLNSANQVVIAPRLAIKMDGPVYMGGASAGGPRATVYLPYSGYLAGNDPGGGDNVRLIGSDGASMVVIDPDRRGVIMDGKQVTWGPVDSCGVGYRCMRVPN